MPFFFDICMYMYNDNINLKQLSVMGVNGAEAPFLILYDLYKYTLCGVELFILYIR